MLKIKTELLIGLGLMVLVLGIAGFTLLIKLRTQNQISTSIISLTDLAKHSQPEDCWVALKGNVYNLSTFISKHPGGAKAIETNCGKDGTEVFETRYGKGPHQAAALLVIAALKVGTLQ
ncbi:MAG TPA: hypothetical protein DEP87_01880 [Candidatus Pacebacteria bacterium]|nr:hypothetical protein [Candidatus Paceibacterota bacterium]